MTTIMLHLTVLYLGTARLSSHDLCKYVEICTSGTFKSISISISISNHHPSGNPYQCHWVYGLHIDADDIPALSNVILAALSSWREARGNLLSNRLIACRFQITLFLKTLVLWLPYAFYRSYNGFTTLSYLLTGLSYACSSRALGEFNVALYCSLCPALCRTFKIVLSRGKPTRQEVARCLVHVDSEGNMFSSSLCQ